MTSRKLLAGAAALAVLAGCGAPDGTPTPVVTGAQKAASTYARCLADLRAEHDRWVRDPSVERNPPSCDQPGVSAADYLRAWTAAGGDVWVGAPTRD